MNTDPTDAPRPTIVIEDRDAERVVIEPRRVEPRRGAVAVHAATVLALAFAAGVAAAGGAPALPPGGLSLPRRQEVRVLTNEDLARIERARVKRERKAAQKAGSR